jgi:hypothetical protein
VDSRKVTRVKQDKEQILAARMPKTLVRRLEKASKAAGRSRSSELRFRLEQSLAIHPVLLGPVQPSAEPVSP